MVFNRPAVGLPMIEVLQTRINKNNVQRKKHLMQYQRATKCNCYHFIRPVNRFSDVHWKHYLGSRNGLSPG